MNVLSDAMKRETIQIFCETTGLISQKVKVLKKWRERFQIKEMEQSNTMDEA